MALPDGINPAAARRLADLGLRSPSPSVMPPQQGGRATGTINTPRPTTRPTSRPTVKTNSSGNYARPASPPRAAPGPVAPSIETYLAGDTGFQQQSRDLAQALSNFLADVTRRRGSMEAEHGLSVKALQDQRVKDLDYIEDDYGARNLLKSGLYADAVGDYETEFGTRMSDMNRRQQEALGLLQQEEGQFKSAQQLKEQAAREMAIRRRAEQFGV